jgi:hypothetical protein
MTSQFMDEEKLVEIVEELKADIYHKHEVRSERELGILLQELKKAVERDCQAKGRSKPDLNEDWYR